MKKKTHDLLVAAYKEWQEVALSALRAARGPRLDNVTHGMIACLNEVIEAGGDPLDRLREIHQRLIAEFEVPKKYDSSYYVNEGDRSEMARLAEEIGKLEKEG